MVTRAVAASAPLERKLRIVARDICACAKFVLKYSFPIFVIPLVALSGHNNFQANYYKTKHVLADTGAGVDAYHQFPSWMHTDPVQAIGLPAQVAPDFLPNLKSIDEAWELFNNVWHPEDWKVNDFRNARDAHKAFNRSQAARDILLYRSKNSTCTNSTNPEYMINDEPYTVDPYQPLRHFAKGCACTLPTWLRDQALQGVVPPTFCRANQERWEEFVLAGIGQQTGAEHETD